MKKKKLKNKSIQNEDQIGVTNLIRLLLVIIGIVLVLFLVTKYLIRQEKPKPAVGSSKGTIDYSKIIVGTLLSQSESEYYVIAFDGNAEQAISYTTIMESYASQTKSLKIYWIDLANKLNQSHVASNPEMVNTEAKDITALKLGEITLLKIKNHAIEKTFTTVSDIKHELQIKEPK